MRMSLGTNKRGRNEKILGVAQAAHVVDGTDLPN